MRRRAQGERCVQGGVFGSWVHLGASKTKCHPGAPDASAPPNLSQTPRAHDGEELATVREQGQSVMSQSRSHAVLCPARDSGKCGREMCSLLEKWVPTWGS